MIRSEEAGPGRIRLVAVNRLPPDHGIETTLRKHAVVIHVPERRTSPVHAFRQGRFSGLEELLVPVFETTVEAPSSHARGVSAPLRAEDSPSARTSVACLKQFRKACLRRSPAPASKNLPKELPWQVPTRDQRGSGRWLPDRGAGRMATRLSTE